MPETIESFLTKTLSSPISQGARAPDTFATHWSGGFPVGVAELLVDMAQRIKKLEEAT